MDEEVKNIKQLEEQLKKVTDDRKQSLMEEIKILNQVVDLNKEDIANLQANIKVRETLLKRETDAATKKKGELELAKEQFLLAQKQLQNAIISGEVGEENIEILEENLKKQKEILDKEEKKVEKQKEQLKLLDKISQSLKNMIGTYGQAIISQFSLNGLTSRFGDFVTEIIDSQRKLIAQTGKIDLFNPELFEASRRELGSYGIGLREINEAFADLDSGFSNFSNLSDTVRHQIADQSVKFTNLSVSMKDQTKVYQELTRGIGMGAIQSAASLDKILVAAKQVGVSLQRAVSDLASVIGQLSSHGKNVEKVFIELQKQSKQLGLEINTMLGIVGKGFDTFEGAADKAGKLNALLGGDFLNSVEMLNATEDERIEIMRRAFDQSGKNFDQLDRFEKKAIANALGLKDEAEARKLLGHLSAEEQLNLKKEETARRELEEAQKQSADTMRLLQLSLSDFIVLAKPVAKKIRELIVLFNQKSKTIGTVIKWSLILFGVLKGFSILASVAMWAVQFTAAFKIAAGTAAPASASIATGITTIGQAATASAAGLLTLSVVIISIGASIAIASLGLAKLVESFAVLKEGQFIPALTGIAIAIGGMALAIKLVVVAMLSASAASLAAAPGLGIFAGVILAIGTAVGIAAAGIGFMVGKFADMFKEMTTEKVKLLYDIALGFAAIGSVMTLNIFGMNNFLNMIKDVVAGINEIKTDDTFKARVEILKTITQTIETAKNITPEQIRPAKEFVSSAKEYYQAQKESKDASNDTLIQALKQIMKPEGVASGTETKTPVIIRLTNDSVLFGEMDQLASTIGYKRS